VSVRANASRSSAPLDFPCQRALAVSPAPGAERSGGGACGARRVGDAEVAAALELLLDLLLGVLHFPERGPRLILLDRQLLLGHGRIRPAAGRQRHKLRTHRAAGASRPWTGVVGDKRVSDRQIFLRVAPESPFVGFVCSTAAKLQPEQARGGLQRGTEGFARGSQLTGGTRWAHLRSDSAK
jgi:hypothetical protein